MALGIERHAEHGAVEWIVVDDEDRGGGSRTRWSSWRAQRESRAIEGTSDRAPLRRRRQRRLRLSHVLPAQRRGRQLGRSEAGGVRLERVRACAAARRRRPTRPRRPSGRPRRRHCRRRTSSAWRKPRSSERSPADERAQTASSTVTAGGCGRQMGRCRKRRRELLGPDRFGQVVVHAGLEAGLAVALHARSRSSPRCAAAPAGEPARIWRVASRPSISGICTSISTRSYGQSRDRFDGLDAVGGDVGAIAHRLEHEQGDLLVHRVVLGQQDPQGMAFAEHAKSGQRVDGSRHGSAEQRHEHVEELRLLDRLGQHRRRTPGRARRRRARCRARAGARAGASRRRWASSTPSMPGMCMSRIARSYASPPSTDASASPADATAWHPSPHASVCRSRMRRLIALSSTTSTCLPVSSRRHARRGCPHGHVGGLGDDREVEGRSPRPPRSRPTSCRPSARRDAC